MHGSPPAAHPTAMGGEGGNGSRVPGSRRGRRAHQARLGEGEACRLNLRLESGARCALLPAADGAAVTAAGLGGHPDVAAFGVPPIGTSIGVAAVDEGNADAGPDGHQQHPAGSLPGSDPVLAHGRGHSVVLDDDGHAARRSEQGRQVESREPWKRGPVQDHPGGRIDGTAGTDSDSLDGAAGRDNAPNQIPPWPMLEVETTASPTVRPALQPTTRVAVPPMSTPATTG